MQLSVLVSSALCGLPFVSSLRFLGRWSHMECCSIYDVTFFEIFIESLIFILFLFIFRVKKKES